MPITGWHAARMKNPDDFQKGSFVTLKIGGANKGILLISGRLKGKTTLTEQAYRFSMDKFTVEQAKKWLKDNNKKPISFEPGVKPEKSFNYDDFKFDGEIEEKDLPDYEDTDIKNSNNEIEYKTFSLELEEVKLLKIDDDEKGVFIGAMASQAKDLGNDIIAPDAFDNTLAEYRKAKQNIQLYYNHQTMDLPIGIISFKNVEQEGKNWNVKGELNLETQKGAEVYALMRQKALTDLSFGYIPIDVDFKGKSRLLKEVKLLEVSVVGKGMNPKAKVGAIKASDNQKDNENEQIHKFDITDVENIETKVEFNEVLRKSGSFSNAACEYMTSCFVPKQSKSVTNDKGNNVAEIKAALLEIKDILKKL
jgi:HK97 family phage prohead protease